MIGRSASTRRGGIRQKVARRFFVQIGRADPDLVFVAGVGRSGTTWLAEMLAHSSRRRLMFEPFDHERVPLWRQAHAYQYIRPADSDHPLLDDARAILAGDLRSSWVDHLNEHVFTRGRLIKDIRANLMLGWLSRQLGPFPTIFLIRHPGAVAASWEHLGWSTPTAETYLTQPELVEDHLAPFHDEIAAASGSFEYGLFSWAIQMAVVRDQLEDGSVLPVFYERLVVDPLTELRRIAEHVGYFVDPDAEAVADPSPTSLIGRAYASESDRLHSWRAHVTDEQIDRLHHVLALFGVDDFYGADGLPAGSMTGAGAVA